MSDLVVDYEEIDETGLLIDLDDEVDYDPYADDPYAIEEDYDPYADEFDRAAFILDCVKDFGFRVMFMNVPGVKGSEVLERFKFEIVDHPDLKDVTEADEEKVVEIGKELWDEIVAEMKPRTHFDDLCERFADEMLDGGDYERVDSDDLRDRFYKEADKVPEDARLASDIEITRDQLVPAWRRSVDEYLDERSSTEEEQLYMLLTQPATDADYDRIYTELMGILGTEQLAFPAILTSSGKVSSGEPYRIRHYDALVDDFLGYAKFNEMDREEFDVATVYTKMLIYATRCDVEPFSAYIDDLRRDGKLHQLMVTRDIDPVADDDELIHFTNDYSRDFYKVSEVPEDVLAEALNELGEMPMEDVSLDVRRLPEIDTLEFALRMKLREAGLSDWENYPYVANSEHKFVRIDDAADLVMICSLEYFGNDTDAVTGICSRPGVISAKGDISEAAATLVVDRILDGEYVIRRTPGQVALDMGKAAFGALGRTFRTMMGH